MSNNPSSAGWYKDGVNAFLKFKKADDLLLDDIDVTFLRNFQAYHESKGNSKNSISAYLRAVRAIYNSAIAKERFKLPKIHFITSKCLQPQEQKKGQSLKIAFWK